MSKCKIIFNLKVNVFFSESLYYAKQDKYIIFNYAKEGKDKFREIEDERHEVNQMVWF